MGYGRSMPILYRRVKGVIQERLRGLGYGQSEKSLELAVLESQFSRLGLDFPRVLEIGTFRGEFTAFLGALFPEAYVETWDLPCSSDPQMQEYCAEFEKHYHDQSSTRIINLKDATNIHQIFLDSTHLVKSADEFDLVWVDGDHSFPVVAFDIINALRLASPKAWIVVDDIKLTDLTKSNLGSTQGFECVRHLTASGLVDSSLVYKRVGNNNRHWRDDNRRKHLAVMRTKDS
jgi:predicted O-methyltransferase YrrM